MVEIRYDRHIQPSDQMHYFYLHGFASGPQSAKAIYFRDRAQALHLNWQVPDLNQGDFFHLTLTRQIAQVLAMFPGQNAPVTVVGSSFGGLTAAWIAQRQPQVQRLILLAPAFSFLEHWLPQLGAQQLQQWQKQSYLEVYHYAEERSLPLSYNFVQDLKQYQDEELQRPVPTLILHGQQDEVIPIQSSQQFVATRPWAKLMERDSDHALANVKAQIWEAILDFCQ